MKVEFTNPYKSIPAPSSFELPNFTVLIGENGSGKTHLLSMLNDPNYCTIFNGDQILENKKFVPYNGLNPKIEAQADYFTMSQKAQNSWQEISQAQKNYNAVDGSTLSETNGIEMDPIFRSVLNPESRQIMRMCYEKYNKFPSQIKEDDIQEFISLVNLEEGELFTSKLAQIFKGYANLRYENKLIKFHEQEGIKETRAYLEEEQFVSKYGKPPWELVDNLLDRLELPYRVKYPEISKKESPFDFKLLHKVSDFEIGSSDLSTGELTLLSLALALYNTDGKKRGIDFLILDEPDAPLHPSMSRMMIDILEKEFVEKRSISVIISTHSPATIACAPSYSLYKITKQNKQPVHCTLEDSISLLSYGIPNLKVSMEARRQVFVESSYDAKYYETLFDILSKDHHFSTQPRFITPNTHDGCNCSDVIKITEVLHELGNTQIYGLIDWDGKNLEKEQLIVLGLNKRYAIENYLLEPHLLGLYLLHKKISTLNELGIDGVFTYRELSNNISTSTLQRIIDSIEARFFADGTEQPRGKAESKLISGEIVMIDTALFKKRGHDLEAKYKEMWPQLKGVRGPGDSAIKNDLIITIINDFPELLSRDILDVFHQFK